MYAEAIGFITDYDNLVGTVTESTGGGGEIGDQFEGGEAIVRGIELLGETVLWEFAGGWRCRRASPGPGRRRRVRQQLRERLRALGRRRGGRPHAVRAGAHRPAASRPRGDRLEVNLNFNYQDETRTGRPGLDPVQSERTDSALVVDLGATYQLTRNFSAAGPRAEPVRQGVHRVPLAERRAPGIDRWAMVGLQASTFGSDHDKQLFLNELVAKTGRISGLERGFQPQKCLLRKGPVGLSGHRLERGPKVSARNSASKGPEKAFFAIFRFNLSKVYSGPTRSTELFRTH
jgi:hypothetical protein